ncbi:MAG: hypothetical protein HY538_05715 [Deltaproteobacteria bacterium]|nr:hypothetical protein [Deltaproteobacteria bacterium]
MNTPSKLWLLPWIPLLAAFLLGAPGCSSDDAAAVAVSANAGEDADALVSDTVTLDGLASIGVDTVSWSFDSKPTGSSASLSKATTLSPTFVPDVIGSYVAKLSINNGASTDTVTVTAKNLVAAITTSGAITTRERFNSTEYVLNLEQTGGSLSGANSRVASGATIASYAWEQVSGPGATTTNGTTNSALEFTGPSLDDFFNASDQYKWQVLPVSRDDTKMVFKLTVTDGSGNSDSETLSVYVANDGSEIHRSTGLPNVAIKTGVYLSGPNLKATSAASTAITDWSWTLSPPSGSSSTFSDSGTTSSSLEFPKFIPDVEGIYTVAYSSTSAATSGTLLINAADWVGVGTIGGTTPVSPQCANCHDGTIQGDKTTGWSETHHADLFSDSIGTYAALAPEPYLWEFHTVGYDSSADNSGFDDLVTDASFAFPESGMSYLAFTSGYPDMAKLANVQCENCHGPGSQHTGDPLRTSFSSAQFGVCGQCHIQETQWKNSAHNSTGVAHDRGGYQTYWVTNSGCLRCHNARGFATHVDNIDDWEASEEAIAAVAAAPETGAFPGITCAGCHDPHDATNDFQLRLEGNVTMVVDGSTVDAGKAAVCYTCHDALYQHDEVDCDANRDGTAESICDTLDESANQYWRQVHYNPQAPVLEGKGALTDLNGDGTADFSLTDNSFHTDADFTLAGVTGDTNLSAENNKCVTCHMATGPGPEEEGYQHLGGHALKLRTEHGLGHLQGEETEADEEAEAGDVELASICTTCHASVTAFNRLARDDYDGDGSQEGIQDEVTGLLLALSNKIKSLDATNISSSSGTVESSGEVTVDAIGYNGSSSSAQAASFNATTDTLRRAVWNHNLIARDGSLGIHNAGFALQVLQKTYTAAGGNSFTTDFPNAKQR